MINALITFSHRFLHNTGAVVGTFTVIGVIVLGVAILVVVTRLKRRKEDINFSDDYDDYVVNDRSGRTGFSSVNYGNASVTEMSERHYGDHSYMGNDVEHTLGQEIIQVLCGVIWGVGLGFVIVAVGTILGEVANYLYVHDSQNNAAYLTL